MDLGYNEDARFTRWVVANDLLAEPFVVVDVGVQGGENPRWDPLGDRLVVHGFDAIEEVIRELREGSRGDGTRHFHWIGASNEDGERDFFFRIDDPFSSSFYQPGVDRQSLDARKPWQTRRVQVRKLDTLLQQGVIPPADFVKIDVEGFEKHVLAGAQRLLATGILGMEIESNFHSSPEYPTTHFAMVQDLVLPHGLRVFDLNFNRVPRASFQQALRRAGRRPIADQQTMGQLSTLVVLFCRDFTAEADHLDHFATPPPAFTLDQITKLMIVYELHGLNDVAADTAERFRERLRPRLDVDQAIRLLASANVQPRPSRGPAARLRRLVGALARRAARVRRLVRARRAAGRFSSGAST
jgi:FkbM family methyltransferase